MMPSGHPTPMGGAQSVSPSLLRSNSSITLQPTFPSPRSQYNNINLIGNMSNVSSLLNQSFGNGGSNSGLLGSVSVQRGGIDTDAESGVSFNPSYVSFSLSNTVNPNSSDLTQGPQFLNSSNHQQQQQQQYQSIRGGLGIGGPVKLEPQMVNNQNGPQQQLQPLQNLGQVKLEPQQIQTLRSLASVKLEPQYSDQLLFQQQQQQQQKQFVHMSRQSSQSAAAAAAQMNILQQQRLLLLQQQHQQHQQQQQLLKTLPQQRSQLQPQNLPVRVSPIPAYEPGMCDRRLTRYMYQQQHRPADNNIEFWRKFVADNFMLICPMNIRMHQVKLCWIMQKQFRKVFLTNYV